MSLKLKLGLLLLVIIALLAGSLWVFINNAGQLQDIANRRRLGQVMLFTSEKLALGKQILQSDLPDKKSAINQLLDDIFLMQAAVNTNLRLEDQPEISAALRDIQVALPAISLLLQDFHARLSGGQALTQDDILRLNLLDSIVSTVGSTVTNYDQYLNTEEKLVAERTNLLTNIIIAAMIATVLAISLIIFFNILSPISTLTQSAQEISQGDYSHQTQVKGRDEFGQLGNAFNTMTSRLRELINTLEQRVADRTKALATSTEVSRRLSTILNQKELVTEVVNQVNNAFGYYHTQIYFYDDAKDNLVMAGGTGEAGEKMLAQFHKIQKGRGLVGRAAESNQAVLVSDTSQNPEWLPNPLLPDTKSEAAIPISIGDRVLGVLDTQHNVTNGLQQEDVDLLQSIANQIAVALQNIDSTETVVKRAKELQTVATISTAAATIGNIEEMLQEVVHLTQRGFGLYHAHIFTYDEKTNALDIIVCGYREGDEHEGTHGTTSIPLDQEQSLVARAGRTRQAVIVNDVRSDAGWQPNPILTETASELAVPLIVGDQLLGVLDVQSERVNAFTEEDASIQSTLASQVATALQNARSFQQAQKQAERESAVNLITQKIQSTTSVEAALQIAARELGHALGMKQTMVSLEPESPTSERKVVVNE